MTLRRPLAIATRFVLCVVLLPLVASADRFGPSDQMPVVALRPNADRNALISAPRLMRAGDYARAIELLQRDVLDRPGDRIVSLPDGNSERTVGTRAEASRLLASLPAKGRRLYEAKYGPVARKLLASRTKSDELAGPRNVVRRFPLTTAGIEAGLLLGTRELRNGRPLLAAILLDGLLRHPSAARVHEPSLSLQTAAAYARAGLPEKAVTVLNELRRSQGEKPLRVAGKVHPWFPRGGNALRWLAGVLQSQAGFRSIAKERWANGQTDLSPSARDALGAFGGRPLWTANCLTTHQVDFLRVRKKGIEETTKTAADIDRKRQLLGMFIIPAARPMQIGGRTVVTRCFYAWRSKSLKSGKTTWWTVRSDEPSQIEHSEPRRRLVRRKIYFTNQESRLTPRLWSDNTSAQASNGNGLVFTTASNSLPRLDQLRQPADQIVGWPDTNQLAGYDERSGKLVWWVGGKAGKRQRSLGGSFFLGPPHSSGSVLYALAESAGAVRLQAIQSTTGRPLWSLPLYAPAAAITLSPIRRLAGCRPISAGGLLICRTADERVFAVQPELRLIVWEYHYTAFKSKLHKPPMWLSREYEILKRNLETDSHDRWVDNAPQYAAGRVILTPRDSNELHCVDAVSGRLLWKRPRGDGLYVAAVAGGNVIIVEHSGMRAVRLADGEPGWKQTIPTPVPSGIGIRAGRFYRLPLSSGEIATIDLAGGRILARVPTPKDHVPGNLAASNDVLVSQNVSTVAAFASGKSLRTQIDQRLKANPNDPAALTIRGELRLQRGEVISGIADLRRAIKLRPSLAAKRALATALAAELRRDFAGNRKLVPEAEALAKAIGDEFSLVRTLSVEMDASGDPRGAFRVCMKFQSGMERVGTLIPAGGSRFVDKTAWVRGRLESLYAKADAGQRRLLDADIATRLAADRATGTAESLRSFLKLFGWHPLAMQARRALVETLRRPRR